MAPPTPVVTILFPLKLKTPISPKVPTCLFLYKLPKASAASSKTFILYFLAIVRISVIFAGCPKTCTTIIALIILFVFC